MVYLMAVLLVITAAGLLSSVFCRDNEPRNAVIVVKNTDEDETVRQLQAYLQDERACGLYGRRIILLCSGSVPTGRLAALLERYPEITAADENTPIGKLMTEECAENERVGTGRG